MAQTQGKKVEPGTSAMSLSDRRWSVYGGLLTPLFRQQVPIASTIYRRAHHRRIMHDWLRAHSTLYKRAPAMPRQMVIKLVVALVIGVIQLNVSRPSQADGPIDHGDA